LVEKLQTDILVLTTPQPDFAGCTGEAHREHFLDFLARLDGHTLAGREEKEGKGREGKGRLLKGGKRNWH